MSETLKFGNGQWAVKEGSALAYNDTNGNFKPLPFTFDRSTSATRVNKEGLIEVVSNNEPRIDFLNDSKGALLLEPSRSNLIQYSDFSSVWTNLSNFTLNTVISPQGIQNGNTLSKDSAFDASSYIISSGVPSGQIAVFSVFVKKNTTNIVGIRLSSGSSASDIRKNINLDTGEITDGIAGNQIGFISLEKEDFGNGWYRLKLKGTMSGNDNVCSLYAGSIGTTTNDGEVYVYGAQLEEGSYPTSYIPTQGSIGTRVAETCEQTNINTSIISSSYPFTIYVKSTNIFGYGEMISFLNTSAADNYFVISIVNNVVTAYARANSSLQNIISGVTLSNNEVFKAAFTMESETSGKLSVNGNIVSRTNFTNQAVNVNINDLLLGQLRKVSDTGNRLPINEAKLYNKALTDAELQALTKI